ncbi:unnamed protein product, partial [Protopolystoma xenopodis]
MSHHPPAVNNLNLRNPYGYQTNGRMGLEHLPFFLDYEHMTPLDDATKPTLGGAVFGHYDEAPNAAIPMATYPSFLPPLDLNVAQQLQFSNALLAASSSNTTGPPGHSQSLSLLRGAGRPQTIQTHGLELVDERFLVPRERGIPLPQNGGFRLPQGSGGISGLHLGLPTGQVPEFTQTESDIMRLPSHKQQLHQSLQHQPSMVISRNFGKSRGTQGPSTVKGHGEGPGINAHLTEHKEHRMRPTEFER